jgi:ACR3 family arsenite transporter
MGGRFDAITQYGEKRGVGLAASLFGFDSVAALATVVGVLVEVPVMLSVVAIVMRSKAWYQRA